MISGGINDELLIDYQTQDMYLVALVGFKAHLSSMKSKSAAIKIG